MTTTKITNVEMQNIYHFIRQSVYDLKHLTNSHRDIKVAIPSWILYLFKNYPMYEYRSLDTPRNQLSENLFCGIEVQPHFKNEIVVFYTDYHINPERFKPSIYEIQFTTGIDICIPKNS
jgi:hypothetical protein